MKKCISFLLITMIVLLANVTLVSADTSVLNFLDTFDELDVGTISATGVTSYAHAFGAAFYNEGAFLEITEDGYKGNALTITENDTSRFKIALLNETAAFAPTADAPVHISFKLRVDNNIGEFSIDSGYDTLCCTMKSDNDYFFSPNNKSGNMTCVPGEWYDIQVKFSPNRADIRITDKNGTSVTGYRANNANYLVINSSRANNQPTVAGQQISIDEIRILQGEEISTEPEVKTSEGLTQPTKGVSRMPEFNFCYEPFMNVVSNGIVVSVADEEGESVGSDMYEVTTNFETVNVKFTEMLEKDTTYTITILGVKDMDGADVSAYDFIFTTELAHKLTLNSLNITSGDTPAIELTFDGIGGYTSTDVRVMSVIYDDGMMSYLDYRTGIIDADGNLVLSSYILPSGKELSDLTVLVFADSQQLIPVCEAIKCFE